MRADTIARLEKRVRPLLTRLAPDYAAAIYSRGRREFLKKLVDETSEVVKVPEHLATTCWGLNFRSPLFNGAGMFKNGKGYRLSQFQGAGAFLGGTSLWNKHDGNTKLDIKNPFAPYPHSKVASNDLGLPNDGDLAIALRYEKMHAVEGFPKGHSVMESPQIKDPREKLDRLVQGMLLYVEAGIDLLESNYSCPNTGEEQPKDTELYGKLQRTAQEFRSRSPRYVPLIAKMSNDTPIEQVPEIMGMLFETGWDGVNFGNSSKQYDKHREHIHPKERALYDFFCDEFGGGVTGAVLKGPSLMLATRAVQCIEEQKPEQEFHVIRTGGIENADDLVLSNHAGISLNQWVTGYFEAFSHDGHNLYQEIYKKIKIK